MKLEYKKCLLEDCKNTFAGNGELPLYCPDHNDLNKSTTMEEQKNQCDGCKAGMPIKNGIHYNKDKPDIYCQKDKYAPVMEEQEKLREEFDKINGEMLWLSGEEEQQVFDWFLSHTIPKQTLEDCIKEEEIVICAAIRMSDGYVVRGHRHADAIRTASQIPKYKDERTFGENHGFVTSKNRYVNRIEGAKIQKSAGIVSKMPEDGAYLHGELYSEDLY